MTKPRKMQRKYFVYVSLAVIVSVAAFLAANYPEDGRKIGEAITEPFSKILPSQNKTEEGEQIEVPQTEPEQPASKPANESRFVDDITKISTERNSDNIQKELDELSYASIIVKLDKNESMDSVLSALSKDEFKLKEVGQISPFFAGDATKEAISKLEQNTHVIKIYHDSGPTITGLQDSV